MPHAVDGLALRRHHLHRIRLNPNRRRPLSSPQAERATLHTPNSLHVAACGLLRGQARSTHIFVRRNTCQDALLHRLHQPLHGCSLAHLQRVVGLRMSKAAAPIGVV